MSAERGSIGSVGEKSPLHSSWCRPKGISFARVKTRNRAFRISGFQARPPLPFHAPHPGLWWAYCDAHGSSTSPLRPKTNPSGTHRCSEKEVHGSSGARRVNVGIRVPPARTPGLRRGLVVRQNVARATLQRLLSTWRNAFGLDSRRIGGGRELLPESVDGQRLRLGSDKRERAWSFAK